MIEVTIMASRMERYYSKEEPTRHSRSIKNEHLYKDLYQNKIITEFTDMKNENVIPFNTISQNSANNRREVYQKNKLFSDSSIVDMVEKKPKTQNVNLEDVSLIEKNYNINDILEQAKKNRSETDSQEEKKHLKAVEYSILEDISEQKEKQEKREKISLFNYCYCVRVILFTTSLQVDIRF